MRHQGRLKSELTKIKVKKGASSNEDLVSQKVKDAGNNKNMYFTRKGEY
jgi:putative methyltransferase